MTFLPKALRFTRDAMASYIFAIPNTGMKPNPNTGRVWSPVGITMHNTALPDLKIWASYSEAQKEAWGDNYDLFCKTVQHWHSAPHFCATPEPWSFVLADLQADGIHDSCTNADHFGVETVGNFEFGGDDPASPGGVAAIDSAINIIAALNIRFGFDPEKLDFHRNCARDAHHCPGSLVKSDDIVARVKVRMAEIQGMKITGNAPAPLANNLPPAATPQTYTIELTPWPALADDPAFFALGARIFNQWKICGVINPFALGMLAQAEAECSLNVKAIGDSGTAFGLHQWHADRCAALAAGCGVDPRKDPPVEAQVNAAWWELTHIETAALAKIRAAETAKDAGIAACVFFERAGAPLQAEKRGAAAERWADLFQAHPDLLTQNPAQPIPAA